MSHLIPPFPLTVSATIPSTIQSTALIATAIVNVIQSSDLRESGLLSADIASEDVESNVVSVLEAQESSFSVSDILSTDSGSEENPIGCGADKIVETIISKAKNSNDAIESYNRNLDNDMSDVDISDVVVDSATNNVTKNIASVEGVENIVETVSGDNVLSTETGGRVGGRNRPLSRREISRLSKFHRIAAVRIEQGVSLSRVAKHLQIDISEARNQENESTDLRLSQLYGWREVLEVSAGELVLEPEEIPVNPIRNRCQLVRLMKTVRSIIIESKSEVTLILARQLESQLIELMPELATIAAWPSIGQSRDHRTPGAATTKCNGFGNIYLRRSTISAADEQ